MYSARVEADFAAAHFLTHYNGKCEHLHGHNYVVRVRVEGQSLDEGGMLVDFGILKGALRAVLVQLDHRCLNDIPEFLGDPSAERIARHIYEAVSSRLPSVRIAEVEVFETPLCVASYRPD